jgi:hypothetical protein
MTPLLLLIASPNKRKASTLPVLAFGARSAAGRPARMTAGLVVAVMSGTPSTLAGYAPPASINGLRRNAPPVSSGRHTRIGTRSDLLILALDGQAALTLNPKPVFDFISTAEAIPLPKTKPRALREDFVVPSIRSREVARAQRSIVRRCEDALYPLDFGNSLLGVHSVAISNMSGAIVKWSSTCMPCVLPRHRSLLRNSPPRDEVNREAPQPMPAFVMLAGHSRQTSPPVCLGSRHDRRQPLVVLR